MSLEYNIGYLFHHIAVTVSMQSDKVLQDKLGIGFSKYKILLALQANSNIRQKQIAELLGQTEASISRQIKLMHEEGLLQTRIRPENKREHITTLTPKGDKFAEEATAILNQYHAPLYESISYQQQQQFVEILHSMHNSVCRNQRIGSCLH